MELSEKIQKLRKEQGMTQEQFAERLFVSRTAVSKWETGRGMPNMESLQMIARVCGITLDELLRAEEVITIAEQENQENLNRLVGYVDGVVNVLALAGVLLPLYKVEVGNMFYAVPLYQYQGWLAIIYWLFPVAMALCGIVQILLNPGEREGLKKTVSMTGVILNICAILLLILSGQPYPAVLFFLLFVIKAWIKLKKKG